MSRSNFAEFILLDDQLQVVGPMLIMPEDVCRVLPHSSGATKLLVYFDEQSMKYYLVQGSSTEVSEKLFGKSKVDKLKETSKTEGELRDALKYWQDSYIKSQERVEELALEVRNFRERNKYLEKHHQNTDVQIGVGDGTGQMFVYGNYESIQRVQGLIFELEALRQHECPVPVGDRSNSAHLKMISTLTKEIIRLSKDYDVITAHLIDVMNGKSELQQRLNSLILNPCVII